MRAGQLNELVTLMERTESTNEYNEKVYYYAGRGKIRADISVSKGSTAVQTDREVAVQSMECSVRIYNNVKIGDRIMYNGELWQIESVVIDRRLQRKILTLTLANE